MFDPWVSKIPWRREWQLTPVFLPGEFHGQRSLAGYSPWGCKELDITEQLTLSLSLFHAVVRNNPKRSHVPFSQFPSMVTSFKSQPECWFSQDTDCFMTTGISCGHTHFLPVVLSTPGNLSSVLQLHNLSFQDCYISGEKRTLIRGSHSTPGYIFERNKNINSKRLMHSNFHSSIPPLLFFFFFFYNCQGMEAT